MKDLIAVLIFLLVPVIAHADLVNGGFETGDFTGWQTIGDALVVDLSFGTPAAEGTYQALVTDAVRVDVTHINFPFNGYFVTPSVPVFNSTEQEPSPLEVFLNLPGLSLTNFATAISGTGGAFGTAFFGSAIKQSFAGDAGSFLLFRWNYLTNDAVGTGCCDFSFLVLDGTISLLGSWSSPFSTSSTPFFFDETDYQLFATTLETGGTHTLAFGVVQTFDSIQNSALLVDNVSLNQVPEPASWLLVGFGLIGLATLSKSLRLSLR